MAWAYLLKNGKGGQGKDTDQELPVQSDFNPASFAII